MIIQSYRTLRGIGLIETMLTLLVISIAVVALVRFQNYLAYHNSLTQQKNEAIILASNKAESLRDFNVLTTQTGYTAYQDINSGTSTSSGTNTTYTLAWTVTTATNPDYKTISITVSWPDRYGNTQSTTLVTRVAGIDPSYSAKIK